MTQERPATAKRVKGASSRDGMVEPSPAVSARLHSALANSSVGRPESSAATSAKFSGVTLARRSSLWACTLRGDGEEPPDDEPSEDEPPSLSMHADDSMGLCQEAGVRGHECEHRERKTP